MGLARADGMAAEAQAEFALTAESSAGKVIRKDAGYLGGREAATSTIRGPATEASAAKSTPATKRNTPGESTEELASLIHVVATYEGAYFSHVRGEGQSVVDSQRGL